MLRYVIRRFLTAIPTLFLIVTISFFLMRVAPGGPFNQERGLNPDDQGQSRARLFRLDEPLWKQYLYYLNNLLHGNFGPSYNLPDFTVADLFARRPAGLDAARRLGADPGARRRRRARHRRRAQPEPAAATMRSSPPRPPAARSRPSSSRRSIQLVFGADARCWLPVGGWGDGALRQQDRPGDHARAAADRHRRAADARLDDRGAALATISARRARSACPTGPSSSSTRCAARCCRSSPMPARPRRRCSPARSSSRRSSPFPASAATSSMPRSTATTRW